MLTVSKNSLFQFIPNTPADSISEAKTLLSEATWVFKSDNMEMKKNSFCGMLKLSCNKNIPDWLKSILRKKLDSLNEDWKFTKLDLSGADLTGCDLNGFNLCFAILNSAILDGANLRNTTLTCADLTDAKVTNANVWQADLRNANLQRTDFTGTDTTFARMNPAHACLSVETSDDGLTTLGEEIKPLMDADVPDISRKLSSHMPHPFSHQFVATGACL